MQIDRTGFDGKRTNWVEGSTTDGFGFSAKVYAEPSIYGLCTPEHPEGSNVSVLIVRDMSGRVVFHYDRGRYLVDSVGDAALDVAYEVAAALEEGFIV